MLFTKFEEIERAAEADHVVGEEIDPGVTITRRQIFRLGAIAGAGALLAGPAFARENKKSAGFGPVTIDDIVKQLRPLSKELVQADMPNEDAYLHTIAALLARLNPHPNKSKSTRQKVAFAQHLVERPLVIYEIKMQPGAKIELHDHRHYNGVIFGLEGAANIRNFDIVTRKGKFPEGKAKFDIRESQNIELTRGRVSTLSRSRDNIHEVVAGREGARVLDVFTFFRKDARSYYLDVDKKPHGKDKRLYRARWRP